jgi:hypothetical protein
MSPGFLAFRADEEVFREASAAGPTDAYLGHWLKLIENGISAKAMENIDRSQSRCATSATRILIFDPQVDPVWSQVARSWASKCRTSAQILRRAA